MAAEAMRLKEADLSWALVMCSKTPELIGVPPIMRVSISQRLNGSDWPEGFDLSWHARIYQS